MNMLKLKDLATSLGIKLLGDVADALLDKFQDTLEKLVSKFDRRTRISKLTEECGEFVEAIARTNKFKVKDELADVMIVYKECKQAGLGQQATLIVNETFSYIKFLSAHDKSIALFLEETEIDMTEQNEVVKRKLDKAKRLTEWTGYCSETGEEISKGNTGVYPPVMNKAMKGGSN